MFCQKCGTENKDDASFCSKCGNDLKSTIQKTEKKGITYSKNQKINSILLLIIFFYSLYLMLVVFIGFLNSMNPTNPIAFMNGPSIDEKNGVIAIILFFASIVGMGANNKGLLGK